MFISYLNIQLSDRKVMIPMKYNFWRVALDFWTNYSDKGNYLRGINHDMFWLFNIDSYGHMMFYLLNMVISP